MNVSIPQTVISRERADAIYAAAPRTTYHVIDLRSQISGGGYDDDVARIWWETYRAEAVGIRPGDTVLVGTSGSPGGWYLPPLDLQVNWHVRGGKPDSGAALARQVDVDELARRFGRLVVAACDGVFAPLVREVRARGVEVQLVEGPGVVDQELRRHCPKRTMIRLPSNLKVPFIGAPTRAVA